MRVQDFSGKNLDRIMEEIKYDINLLYIIPCVYTKKLTLDHLRDRILMLESVIAPLQPADSRNQPTFTLQEMSGFDGKDGNPAYVAVNGIVYDVTNNSAWAAATHFGLTAGKDLTNAFASCHAGQPILSKLKAVGKLV